MAMSPFASKDERISKWIATVTAETHLPMASPDNQIKHHSPKRLTPRKFYNPKSKTKTAPVLETKQEANERKVRPIPMRSLSIEQNRVQMETPTKKFGRLASHLGNKSPIEYYQSRLKKRHSAMRTSAPKKRKMESLTISTKPSDSTSVKILSDVGTSTTQKSKCSRLNLSNESLENNCDTLSVANPSLFTKVKENEKRDHEVQTPELLDKTSSTLADISGKMNEKKALFQRQDNPEDDTQLVIDAGQANLGSAYQCPVCRMIYSQSEPTDITLHRQYHSRMLSALKFPGWKKENIAEQSGSYRIVIITHDDPKFVIKKVEALKEILDQELGFVPETTTLNPRKKMYLYVADKTIRGMCIAESISRANRLQGMTVSESSYRTPVGVNRIWVYSKYRREGIATKLLDSVRSTFGMGICVPRSEIAFSDPTSHGKRFAEKYTGSVNFLVYKPGH